MKQTLKLFKYKYFLRIFSLISLPYSLILHIFHRMYINFKQRFKPSYENMNYNKLMNTKFSNIDFKIIGNIGIICLNNPENRNILDINVFKEINHALDLFKNKPGVKIILFKANCFSSSKGKIFSAGVNLKEYDKKFKMVENNPIEFEKMLKFSRDTLKKIESLHQPVIAAIDGLAVGGSFEIILACDLVLASKSASFYFGEVNIALIPGYGGIHRLLKSVGKQKTFEIIASGKQISTQEAFDLGIVSQIYEDNDFNNQIIEYANNLCQKSSNALFLIKKTINEITALNNIDSIEINNFLTAIKSPQAKEGVNAFLQKRKAIFD